MTNKCNSKDVLKEFAKIFKKSYTKSPISTSNKVADYVLGKTVKYVKPFNYGYLGGQGAFALKQAYKNNCKRK